MADTIKKIVEVFLPFEEALIAATKQGITRLYRMGRTKYPTFDALPKVHQDHYLKVMRNYMEVKGKGLYPDYPDTEHYCVENFVSPYSPK